MEKIKCICVMRDLFLALSELESQLTNKYGISLNEAMVLCSVGEDKVAASGIVERTGLTASHASKVISSVEKKGFLHRHLGEKDKRQMYFTLTDEARDCLDAVKNTGVEIPDLLLPLFKGKEN